MNNDTFFQLIKDSEKNQNLFFIDQNKTYADLISDAKKVASNIEASYSQSHKFALAIKNPYFAFCAQLGLLLQNKKMTLLSFLEPKSAIEKMQTLYSLDVILTDETIESFLTKKDDFNISLVDIEKNGLNVLSSGSSSESKEIFHPIFNLYLSAQNFIQFFNVQQKDRFLLNLPHHHVGGLLVLWRAFFSHASFGVERLDSFDYISLVPLQLKRILEDQKSIESYKKVKAILIGGALLDEKTRELALKNQLNIFETYAMSETATFVMLNGKVLGKNQVKLDKDHHILIKSPHLSPSVKTDTNGFFHTKDLGEEIDGVISFKGRSDLMFKSAGELLDPVAIETEIKNLSYIKNAVCVEVNDYRFQKALVCFYEEKDESISPERIKNDLKDKLHPYQIPRFFHKTVAGTFVEGLKPKRYLFRREALKLKLESLFSYQFIDYQQKETLVAFHGFMEDLTDFYFLKELKNYNLLLIDLPGHGHSPINSFSTSDEIYFYLNELIDLVKGNSSLTLYGYSMGGRVALELIKAGLKVETLVLESSGLGLTTTEEKTKRYESDLKLFEKVTDLKSFFNHWYENPIFTGYKKTADFQKSIEKKCSHNSNRWQKALNFFSPGNSAYLYEDYLEALKNVPKIKAISGVLDKKYDELYKNVHLENWEHYSLLDVGHNPHKIIPAKILEIIKK